MNHKDVKLGMKVNHHAAIGGPVTRSGVEVTGRVTRLPAGTWVCYIEGMDACVSVEALSECEGAKGGTNREGSRERKVSIFIEREKPGTDRFVTSITCPWCGQIIVMSGLPPSIESIGNCDACGKGFGFSAVHEVEPVKKEEPVYKCMEVKTSYFPKGIMTPYYDLFFDYVETPETFFVLIANKLVSSEVKVELKRVDLTRPQFEERLIELSEGKE